ncbi:hypothetical protein [Tsukamurella paurometabola]|uniref:Uncharacterized protein n=1 Tax=Tsukamurella paurometabola TaxID=2061 RepID=A0ABS5NEA5_TSUPA|nr:hypothetical protein [Tsukamurella paurometabola]MBS4102385.1 hypothetical protein [Tsukamurella paurometabola]
MDRPVGLGSAGVQLWDALSDSFTIDGTSFVLVLNACRIADRLEDMATEMIGASLTVENSKGDVISNPLLVEHRMQLATLRQILSSLGVEKLREVVKDDGMEQFLKAGGLG